MTQDVRKIAKPYAKALYAYAIEKEQVDLWLDFLEALSTVIQDKDLQSIIYSPLVNKDLVKKSILSSFSVIPAGAKNFLEVLSSNKRWSCFPAIYSAFLSIHRDRKNMLEVNITTSVELLEQNKQLLQLELEKYYKCAVTLQFFVSTDILGGIILQAKDWVIDLSIKNKLNSLKQGMLAY